MPGCAVGFDLMRHLMGADVINESLRAGRFYACEGGKVLGKRVVDHGAEVSVADMVIGPQVSSMDIGRKHVK